MTGDATSFLNLTLKNQNSTNQVQKTSGDLSSKQTGKNQQANQTNQLKNTDVFTAAKQGMKAENQTPNALQGGDSGFAGMNLFGDSGFGDTVQFSTKTNNTDKASTATNPIGNMSGANATDNNKDLQEIAQKLGVKADENTVKNKLSSMDSEQLTKLGGDTLDKANDLGLVSTGDVEKANQNNNNTENKDQKVQGTAKDTNNTDKPSFGGFTGKNSSGFNVANNDQEIQEIAEGLGVEADENTIKNKLSSMNPQELVKLDGDTLNKAGDLGYISMGDIEKKLGNNQKNNNNGDNKDESKKIKFGSLSGNEV